MTVAHADHDEHMPDILLKFTFVYTAVPNGRDISISVIAPDLESATERARNIAATTLDLRAWNSTVLPISIEEVIS